MHSIELASSNEPIFVHPTLRDWLLAEAPEDLREAFGAACCNRGKRAGRVLASVPTNKGPKVVGVWRALMSNLAVNRAGLFALIFADPAERAAYDAAEHWLAGPGRTTIVRLAGGAPLEFNLAHHALNPAHVRTFARMHGINPDACGFDWLSN